MAQVIDIEKFCREHWTMMRPGRPCRKCLNTLRSKLAEAKDPMAAVAIAKKIAAAGGGF